MIFIKYEIQEITEDEIDYPYLLSQIKSKPKKLYVIGNKEILREKTIAIVGCRECSKYGEKVAKQLAYNLAKKSYIIVSGLAKRNRYLCTFRNIRSKRKNNSRTCKWA